MLKERATYLALAQHMTLEEIEQAKIMDPVAFKDISGLLRSTRRLMWTRRKEALWYIWNRRARRPAQIPPGVYDAVVSSVKRHGNALHIGWDLAKPDSDKAVAGVINLSWIRPRGATIRRPDVIIGDDLYDFKTIGDRVKAWADTHRQFFRHSGTVTGRWSSGQPEFQFIKREQNMSSKDTHTVRVKFLDGTNRSLYSYLTHLSCEVGDKLIVQSPIKGLVIVEVAEVLWHTKSSNATKYILGRADMSAAFEAEREAHERTARRAEINRALAENNRALNEAQARASARREQVRQEIINERLAVDSAYQADVQRIAIFTEAIAALTKEYNNI
jgi:hypothetical protein